MLAFTQLRSKRDYRLHRKYFWDILFCSYLYARSLEYQRDLRGWIITLQLLGLQRSLNGIFFSVIENLAAKCVRRRTRALQVSEERCTSKCMPKLLETVWKSHVV